MAAPDIPPHTSPIRTPKQLVIVVVLAFVVPITLILALAYLVTSGPRPSPGSPALSPEKVAERIRPVAEVTIGAAPGAAADHDHGASSAPPSAAPAGKATKASAKADGKKVFEGTCVVCHGTGVAGAPKFGDKAQWAPHLMHGKDELYHSALTGKNAMPPKGGNMTLSDDEVKAAVDYMVGAVK